MNYQMTNHNFKFHILFALTAFIPGLLGMTGLDHAQAQIITMPAYQQALVTHWVNHFNQEEKKVMSTFYSLCQITPAEWETWKDAWTPYFKTYEAECKKDCIENNPAPCNDICMRVHSLLAKYRMSHIEVVPLTDWCMSAYDTFITINSDELTDDEWLEHGVLHEIQHIKNKDYFIGYCMTVWFENHPDRVNDEAMHTFLQEFNHFKELRAEIMALCLREESSLDEHANYIKNYQHDQFGTRTYANATFNHPSYGVFYDHIEKLNNTLITYA